MNGDRVIVRVYLKNGQVMETRTHVYCFTEWQYDMDKIGWFGRLTIIGRPCICVRKRYIVGIEYGEKSDD